MNILKQKITVLRGRLDRIKQRDAELQAGRLYRIARWIVFTTVGLAIFAVQLFAVMIWSAIFGGGGSSSRYGRGHAGYVTREEVEDRQGGAPAHFDHELNSYTGPDIRH